MSDIPKRVAQLLDGFRRAARTLDDDPGGEDRYRFMVMAAKAALNEADDLAHERASPDWADKYDVCAALTSLSNAVASGDDST